MKYFVILGIIGIFSILIGFPYSDAFFEEGMVVEVPGQKMSISQNVISPGEIMFVIGSFEQSVDDFTANIFKDYKDSNDLVLTLNPTSNEFGDFSFNFTIPQDWTGNYSIVLENGLQFMDGEFAVRTNHGGGYLDRTVYPVPWSMPPLKQFESGISFDEIQCKDGLVLIQKYNGSPACVKPDSVVELLTRGWTVKQIPVTFSGNGYECTVNFDRPDSSLIIKRPDNTSLPENFELIGMSTSSRIMTTLSYATPDFCTYDTNTMSSTGMISIYVTNPDEIKNGKEFVDSYFSEHGNNTPSQLVEIHDNVGIAKKSVQENFKKSPAKVIFYDEETNMLYTIRGYHSTETLINIALSLQ